MAAGDITFVKCPRGDSFPVRKTASLSTGHQQIICPRCGHDFDVTMDETVERLSPDPRLTLAEAQEGNLQLRAFDPDFTILPPLPGAPSAVHLPPASS